MLATLQRQLERIYEIEIPHQIDDFLVTDPKILEAVEGEDAPEETRVEERLLVVQDGNEVDVALYLDDEVIARLTADDPTTCLHDGNLADYCTVLEGVSHFMYLLWNAHHERGVSLLELEMQAEIDKYVSTALLFGQQASGRVPSNLHRWLFEKPRFDENLDRPSLERYRDANHYAGIYCARLEKRYLSGAGDTGLYNDLRRLYRLTHRAKISCAVEGS